MNTLYLHQILNDYFYPSEVVHLFILILRKSTLHVNQVLREGSAEREHADAIEVVEIEAPSKC